MKYGFGVDLGGTTVKLGLLTEAGRVVEKWEIPTDTREEGKAILPDIARALEDCLVRQGLTKEDVLGIGLGVPGPVDSRGVVNRCINLGWGIVDLPRVLGALTGLPVRAGNDANVAALGECWMGGGQGYDNMILVTLGTGIGGGVVLGGRILTGAHGCAGEIGHIPMDPEEQELCGCGKRGCAEQYGSATGLVRLTRRALERSGTASPLRERTDPTAKDVFDLAASGDALAGEILEEYFDLLGRFLATVSCVLDPDVIVLGGGVSKAGSALLEGVQRHFPGHAFHACRDTRFALAQLGNDAGIYGAMKLVLG